jgi:hypothetical protein
MNRIDQEDLQLVNPKEILQQRLQFLVSKEQDLEILIEFILQNPDYINSHFNQVKILESENKISVSLILSDYPGDQMKLSVSERRKHSWFTKFYNYRSDKRMSLMDKFLEEYQSISPEKS